MAKKAIVIVQDAADAEKKHYFGPFKDGDTACYWAHDNCRGFEWHWEEITAMKMPKRSV